MASLRGLIRFIRALFRPSRFTPGRIEDSAEMNIERERRRGMPGG